MMKKIIAFFLLFSLWFSVPAYPWGRLGHETTADIAQAHLSRKALAAIKDLLGNNDLADIAVCADDIKRHSIRCAGVFDLKMAPQTRNWHFVDVPVDSSPQAKDLQQYCPKDDCVVNQIQFWTDILKTNKDKFRRQQALMYLVHFVGDIHQPLHNAMEENDRGESDAGGNGKPVWFEQKPTTKPINLHHLWDNIVTKDSELKKIKASDLAAKLSAMKLDNSSASVSDWALESFAIAKGKIYPYFHQKGDHYDTEYADKFKPIAYQRIVDGGLRLAEILNGIFK